MIEKIVEKSKQTNKPVYVFAHNFPDKDANASAASLIQYLESQGISAKYVVVKPISFLNSIGYIPLTNTVSSGIAVILDTSSTNYAENTLFNGFAPENTYVIDHHSEADNSIEKELKIPSENVLRNPKATSTCEMLLREFDERQINSELATKLAVGLVSDTGHLKYIGPDTLNNLAKLLNLGADYEKIVADNSKKSKLSYAVGRAQMFQGTEKFQIGDTYGLMLPLDYGQSNYIRNNYGITNPQKQIFAMSNLTHCSFTCIISENPTGIYNAEFRSFPFFKDLNVFELAKRHNGGGHGNASGTSFYSKNGDTLKSIIETIKSEALELPILGANVKTTFSKADLDLKSIMSDTNILTKGLTPELLDRVQSLVNQGASYEFATTDFKTYEQFMLRNELLTRVPQKCLDEDTPEINISLTQSDYDSLISKYNVESFDVLDSIHTFDGVNIKSAKLTLPTGQVAEIDNNGMVQTYLLSDKQGPVHEAKNSDRQEI